MHDNTTIAVHQPNFLPWLGYFYKIANCDSFVLLDDSEYTKNSYINRNRIKTAQGIDWLGLPIKYSGRSKQAISACEIDLPNRSKAKILKTVETNYAKAANFSLVFPSFQDELLNSESNLAQLNEKLISWAMAQLNIQTPLIRSSTLKLAELSGTARLVAICQALKANCYLAGLGAHKYQEDELFKDVNIQLKTTDFKHPTYPQLFGDFVPNLSVLDYLMNRVEVG